MKRLIHAIIVMASGFFLFPATSTDFTALREKFVALSLGIGYDTNNPAVRERLTSADRGAKKSWDTLDKSPDRALLWKDLPNLNHSAQMTTGYNRIRGMAKQYVSPGSALKGNPALLAETLSALAWMHDHVYNANVPGITVGAKAEANRWDWVMGAPIALVNICAMLFPHLTRGQIAGHMLAYRKFQPVLEGDGGNLAWNVRHIAMRAVLLEDESELRHALSGLDKLFEYTEAGDGIHRDGSFIQHGHFAYSVGYGATMLGEIVPVITWLHGTPWEYRDPRIRNLYQWVYDVWEPFILRGRPMDCVAGRGISRGGDGGTGVANGILLLSEGAPPEHAARMKAMVKAWALTDPCADFVARAPLDLIGLAQRLLADASVKPREPLAMHRHYAAMDRALHLRPAWACAISMSSSRIGNFESINGENLRGWYTGEGMVYLYTADLKPWHDAFWFTVDPYRLPGTTVDLFPREPRTTIDRALGQGYRPPCDDVGGVSLDRWGSAGMRFKSWGASLTGYKSWFFFDDAVVCLGAGITSGDGRPIETIVDNRPLGPVGTQAFLVDGNPKATNAGWKEALRGVRWAHLAGEVAGGDVGYFFPIPVALEAARESRTGNRNEVDRNARSETTTRAFLRMSLPHGDSPVDAGYQYALLPGMGAAAVAAYAAKPGFTVLMNTPAAQAVSHGAQGIIAVNIWTKEKTSVGELSAEGPVFIMLRRNAEGTTLAIAEPTWKRESPLTVTCAAALGRLLSNEEGVTVKTDPRMTTMTIDPTGAKGRTFIAKFAPGPNP
jgi:hyaluronate lyase